MIVAYSDSNLLGGYDCSYSDNNLLGGYDCSR